MKDYQNSFKDPTLKLSRLATKLIQKERLHSNYKNKVAQIWFR